MAQTVICEAYDDTTFPSGLSPDCGNLEGAGSGLCSVDCVRAWAQAFLPGRGWSGPHKYFIGRTADKPLVFVPFATQKLFGFRVSALAGFYWPFRTIGIFTDPVGAMGVVQAVAQEVAHRPPSKVLRFGPVSSRDMHLHAMLRELVREGWGCLSRETGVVFELDLSLGEEVLRRGFSESLLKHVQYSRRRLSKASGDVSFQRAVLPSSADLIDLLAGIESRSWLSGAGGELKFSGSTNRRFWELRAQCRHGTSEIVIWTLRCGAVPIAFSAHFETHDSIYVFANTYDEGWKSYSPGSLLTMEVFLDAAMRGKKHLDWGQGDSGYKRRWGAVGGSSLHDILLFSPSFGGRQLARLAARLSSNWISVLPV